jgi:hypothetical protein
MTSNEGHEERITSTFASHWQTQLRMQTSLLDTTLRAMRELAQKHHEVSGDYDKALASWEAAKRDVNHFIGVWNSKSHKLTD